MRIDDYRFYGKLCLAFGMLMMVIGFAVAVLGIQWWTSWLTGETYYSDPYLGVGAGIVIIGVILIVVSQLLYREYGILYREYDIRKVENPTKPVSFCPYCGTAKEEGATYCRKCGKKL